MKIKKLIDNRQIGLLGAIAVLLILAVFLTPSLFQLGTVHLTIQGDLRIHQKAFDLESGMEYLVICLVSLAVSGLTLFSGFGLGTVLMPAMAIFSRWKPPWP